MYICIFGGGPTGLRLADELSKQGHKIELHDKESKLGGCWKVDWDKGYYTEHSPRVMSSSYTEALKILKRYDVETDYIYGYKFYTTSMFLNYFYSNLSVMDTASVVKAMYTIDEKDKRTLKQWMSEKKITQNGQRALRKLSISLATTDDEMLTYIFFKTIREGTGSSLIQSSRNDLWIARWEKDLMERDNIKIFKDSKLLHLTSKDNRIIDAKTTTGKCSADAYICSFPLSPLKDLVENCSTEIQSNWMDSDKFQKYCSNSSYTGLGFQLHFIEELKNVNMWKTKCFSEWNIDIINLNKYSKEPTKNNFIKEVWSCAIVDMETVSSHLKKKVNDIEDINQVINEALRQLSVVFGMSIMPYRVTISKGVFYNKEKKMWNVEHSSYNPTKEGPLLPKGNIENLYSVGPHNLFELTVLESAYKSADFFVKKYFLEE